MQNEPKSRKGKTLRKLSSMVLRLEVEQGHLQWMVTELERKSKVSRALIYRYLGSSRAEIYKNAVLFFTNEFYGFNQDEEAISFAERIARVRKFVIENPHVSVFYLKTRMMQNSACADLIKVEKAFQANLNKAFPKLSKADTEIIHAFIHGMITAPFLTEPRARAAALRVDERFFQG